MKISKTLFGLSWILLAVTGAAGLGATRFFEYAFDPLTHRLLAAAGQLVPLAGLFAIALFVEARSAREAQSSDSPELPKPTATQNGGNPLSSS